MGDSNKKFTKTNTKSNKSNKSNKSTRSNKSKRNKKGQKGGANTCPTGPKKIKPSDMETLKFDASVFKTGKDYDSAEKELNKSALYPGLPPYPPVDKCVIM